MLSKAAAKGLATAATLSNRAIRRAAATKRNASSKSTLTLTRNTALTLYTLTAGSLSSKSDNSLSQFPFTDLLSVYDQYKINWLEIVLFATYDQGQSGVTNNGNIVVGLANDPGGHITAPTLQDISQYGNSLIEPLVAGKVIKYRWTPKPVNNLAAGAYAASNDWLSTATGGDTVPHFRLLYCFQSTVAAATTAGVSGYVRANVTFKGVN